MKKWIRLGLCTAVLAAALACTALAADGAVYGTGAVSYDGAKCSVTYSEGLTDGNQYVLLLVTDPDSINDEGVMYIDQAAAAGGQVSFAGFIPKDWPTDGQTWTALLGGEFTDGASPKTIGTLTFGYGATISVPEVDVSFAGSRTAPKLTLSNGADQTLTFTLGSDGNYTVSGVTDGTYTLTVSKKSHLTYTREIVVSNAAVVGGISEIKLLAGDVNSDDYINSLDVSIVLQDYLKPNMEDAASNINEDNSVNSLDISAVLGNYLKQYD